MPSFHAEDAKPVKLFKPPVARPLRWRMFVRWLRSFSLHTGILLGLVFAAGWGFSFVRYAWVCTAEIPMDRLRFGTGRPFSLSPDGRRVLTVDYGKKAAVYDIESGRVVRELQCFKPHAYRTAWSADGRVFATAEVGSADATVVHLWDAGTGRLIRSIARTKFAGFIALSPDGTELLMPVARGRVATFDVQTGVLKKQWIVADGDHRLDLNYGAHGRYFDDGNRFLVSSMSGFLVLHVRDENRPFVRHPAVGITFHASVLPDGRILTVHRSSWVGPQDDKQTRMRKNAIRIWDASSGECLAVFGNQMEELQSASVSPDGKRVLTLNERGGGDLREVDGGRRIENDAWGDPWLGRFSAWSPDGKYIMSYAIYDAETGEVVQPLCARSATDGEFSPDGRRLVSVHNDATIRLWRRRWDESHGRVMGASALWATVLLALLAVGSALRDTMRSKGSPLPLAARLSAWGWGFVAVVMLTDTALATFAGDLGVRWWMPPAFLLCLLFAIGLLRRSRGWRATALCALWASLALLPPISGALLPPQTSSPPATIEIRLYSMALDVPTPLAVLLFLSIIAFIIGQLAVLHGRKVRTAFGDTPPPMCIGDLRE